ncbi:unnamed protein product [Tetraodon nigroviridis]|uniref:(spotted green pufferfish) hypothetical protein n=1 Tax=Tetraodon nigroviridis TaxID=99883 RepID=Q4S2V3_TETNG|nr:unnamed protein product [Tetraodon nigroviridis]
MGNLHRDSELMSEREEGGWEDGGMEGWRPGPGNQAEFVKKREWWEMEVTNSEGERLADEWKGKRRRKREMGTWAERRGHKEGRMETERGAGRISLC